jgi:hypothetical protein
MTDRPTISLSELVGIPVDDLPFWCPIEPRHHTTSPEALDTAVVQWLIEQGVCEPGSPGTRLNLALALTPAMPYATDEALFAMSCYYYWGFLWDDHIDTLADDLAAVGTQVAEIIRIASEPSVPAPDEVWARSFRHAFRHVQGVLPPDGFAALQAAHSVWCSGEMWKNCLLSRAAPSIDEFFRMRWSKSGTGVIIACTAPLAGQTISPADASDPLVRAFCQSTMFLTILINDIGSFAKELVNGDSGINLVNLIAAHHRTGCGQALLEVYELYERIVALMLALRRRLLEDARPGIAALAADLPLWLPATFAFTLNSDRYLQLATSHGKMFTPPTVTLVDTPLVWEADNFTPPPYPAIAWWWDQLRR